MIATRVNRFTTYVVLLAFAATALYPLISILFLAFHKKTDLVTGFSLPTTFSLQTFVDAWNQGGFAKGMWGSALVAVSVTVVSAVFSLFTGYAFGTMRFRGSGILFNLIVLGLIFPYEA
ncbi:MAG: raffinose/stachyose/melibiose transport system permease protein, partial [Gaiellales bacterium]|nr:raffinose/stachyose/melibiose transport system permease protein [Gaiellales bacterium]